MTLALELVALLVTAGLLAYVWDDLFATLGDTGPEPELLVLPLADGWEAEDVLLTLAEIETL